MSISSNKTENFINHNKTTLNSSETAAPNLTSSARAVISFFEKQSHQNNTAPAPLPVRALVQLGRAQPRTFSDIQKAIGSLDLNNPYLAAQIEALQGDLESLKKRGEITDTEQRVLRSALKLLCNPEAFQPSIFETQLLLQIAEKNPDLKHALEHGEHAIKMAQQEGRRRLIAVFKREAASPNALCENLKLSLRRLDDELPQVRFSYLPGSLTEKEPFNHNFRAHLPQLIKAMETYSINIAATTYESFWKETLAGFDAPYQGRFADTLKHYDYLDPSQNLPEFVALAQGKYVHMMDLNAINTGSPAEVASQIQVIDEKATRNISKFCSNFYKANFYEKHVWLYINLNHIKKSYNQGVDNDRNLGDGTCWRNSLDRERLLFDHPNIGSEEIPFGSSMQGRFGQSQETAAVLHNTNDAPMLDKLLIKTFNRLHLQPVKVVPMNDENGKLMLSDALQVICKKNDQTHFILSLEPKDHGDGHAINIQIDQEHSRFRFMDDNLGVCEYHNIDEFKEQLEKYIGIFYPDLNKLKAQLYKQE